MAPRAESRTVSVDRPGGRLPRESGGNPPPARLQLVRAAFPAGGWGPFPFFSSGFRPVARLSLYGHGRWQRDGPPSAASRRGRPGEPGRAAAAAQRAAAADGGAAPRPAAAGADRPLGRDSGNLPG